MSCSTFIRPLCVFFVCLGGQADLEIRYTGAVLDYSWFKRDLIGDIGPVLLSHIQTLEEEVEPIKPEKAGRLLRDRHR